MKLDTAITSTGYFKSHAYELIRIITDSRRPLVVTHTGKAKVVVQDFRPYEQIQETLALLTLLTLSKQNIRREKVKSMDEAFRSLELRITKFKHEVM